ncbi:DUF3310 domain-containing protein [Staphylococcus pseudoxylosus]|uniref:DUF3310 domain-containing protein n=1 Tax=Staphylococcus pseudoxylosus TaxID=2282419 RepID=UPI002DB97938|nr:DUF3310 domain-containing protein [Staphylococcus pseudoxylosus]MEB7752236.1 DUF3310 domain-containing protein [Staphylococcus pseudoxylosus]
MKIRDLNLNQYVVVKDLGAGKYSSGMRVIGKVIKIDDKHNYAIIESLPKHRYEITDFNDFELWAKNIEDKTESLSDSPELNGFTVDEKLLEEAKEKGIDELRKNMLQSNDVQQRKRNDEKVALFKIKDLKVGYKVKVLGDNMIGEVCEIADNGKSAEIRVDDGVYRIINDNYDFTIIEWNAVPEYAEDTVNHPSHYNYGEIEIIDFIEQVTKHYNPNVAYHIGNAIKYLARSPHKNGKEDVEKAKWYIERAFENWDK